MAFADAFRAKRVLLTGHTGFKGSWLAEWLLALGAQVTGLSLSNPVSPLFEQLGLEGRLNHRQGDIRNLELIRSVVDDVAPDYVFHLAAQPLVLYSYREPVETYGTNIMGTVNVLEAIRLSSKACVVVAVTTDKCYENEELGRAYIESDPMGGHDPYSSSKGAAELVISAYRRSFFSGFESKVCLASARAGNVIGGGDWASDRIVPDCIRALQQGQPIRIRNSDAVRPWQHVLEPLSGYLSLAEQLGRANRRDRSAFLASAFNFGPAPDSTRTVSDLVNEITRHWPGRWISAADFHPPRETKLLALDIGKALQHLHWKPVWSFQHAIKQTAVWYRSVATIPGIAREITTSQISSYTEDARLSGLSWAI